MIRALCKKFNDLPPERLRDAALLCAGMAILLCLALYTSGRGNLLAELGIVPGSQSAASINSSVFTANPNPVWYGGGSTIQFGCQGDNIVNSILTQDGSYGVAGCGNSTQCFYNVPAQFTPSTFNLTCWGCDYWSCWPYNYELSLGVSIPSSFAVSLTPASATVSAGGNVEFTYSRTDGSPYDLCFLRGGAFGSSPGTATSFSGTANTGAVSATTVYKYSCYNSYYGWKHASAQVYVGSGPAQIQATPGAVSAGDTTDITWSTNGMPAGSCSVNNTANDTVWSGEQGAAGAHVSAPLVANTTFTLNCQSAPGVEQTIILTSGSTWTVPANWNDNSNTIEVIGGGSGGGYGNAGGGGAYSKQINVPLTPGSQIKYSVGWGGLGATTVPGSWGGNTYLCDSLSNCNTYTDSAVRVSAQGGYWEGELGKGGSASTGIGARRYAGGNGASAISCGESEGEIIGGGGGGAGGPGGAGATPNPEIVGTTGGRGGGSSGGLGGSGGSSGANGSEWGSAGSGGGGGGGVCTWQGATTGGVGGNYGAGGGGATTGSGGAGRSGVIVIKYTPAGFGPVTVQTTVAVTSQFGITANPTIVDSGTVTYLTWRSSGAQSGTCKVTNTANGTEWTEDFYTAAPGKPTDPLVEDTTFTLECEQSGGSPTTVALTSGSSWTVPADWNSSNNTIELIGGGGGGASGVVGVASGRGGGGGGYSMRSNVSLVPGSIHPYAIGTGGGAGAAGGDTVFDSTVCASGYICAKGGGGGTSSAGGAGGVAASGIGTTKYSGGTADNNTRSGGGGAAGPSGNGATSGNFGSSNAGGGGGAANGGLAGGNASVVDGNGVGGSGGGPGGGAGGQTPGAHGAVGGASAGGGGGAGRGTGDNGVAGNGGAGGAGTHWGSYGAGGGGGAAGGAGGSGAAGAGGTGGLYGGGGGGGALSTSGPAGTGGSGAPGIILIRYTPPLTSQATVVINPPVLSVTANNQTGSISIPSGESALIRWSSQNVQSGSCSVTYAGGTLSPVGGGDNNATGVSTGNLTDTRVYTLACNKPDGTPAVPTAVTVAVQQVGAIVGGVQGLKVSCEPGTTPTETTCRIGRGNTAKLLWQTTNTQSCEVKDQNGTPVPGSAVTSSPPAHVTTSPIVSPTTFTLRCTDQFDTPNLEASVQVLLSPEFIER